MKKPTIAKLKAKAKKQFNLWIRLRDADYRGMCTCVTCGVTKHYKEMNAGHHSHSLDFEETNQHAQCPRCNLYKSGALDEYTLYMIDAYGRDHVEALMAEKKRTHKYTRGELEEIEKEYKRRVKEILPEVS